MPPGLALDCVTRLQHGGHQPRDVGESCIEPDEIRRHEGRAQRFRCDELLTVRNLKFKVPRLWEVAEVDARTAIEPHIRRASLAASVAIAERWPQVGVGQGVNQCDLGLWIGLVIGFAHGFVPHGSCAGLDTAGNSPMNP